MILLGITSSLRLITESSLEISFNKDKLKSTFSGIKLLSANLTPFPKVTFSPKVVPAPINILDKSAS